MKAQDDGLLHFLRRWRGHWSDPRVVNQALMTSAVVGTILLLITLGNRLLRGEISQIIVTKGVLTYLVPYLVSSFTAVRTQFHFVPGQEVPENGTYGCEKCLYSGHRHEETLKIGEEFPECSNFGDDTEYVLKEVNKGL